MIEFNSQNMEDLEEEAKIRAIEVSLAIVEGICNGLDQGADVIALGFMKAQNLDININKPDYLKALELNLPRVEEAEEFELCQRAVQWIDKLKSE
jgi:hypothetical protein|tara:strand:+ start:248 stop:532 length:285 start_codon:yes stop_codon:yes gene_type:complete